MNDFETQTETSEGQIILCGSLSYYGHIKEVEILLKGKGVRCIAPNTPESNLDITLEQISESRRIEAFRHLLRIKNRNTKGILVINPEKHGKKDYIGPSTFAEICVAFAHSKKILILYDFPTAFDQELTEWKAIPFLGDIRHCIDVARQLVKVCSSPQLNLF